MDRLERASSSNAGFLLVAAAIVGVLLLLQRRSRHRLFSVVTTERGWVRSASATLRAHGVCVLRRDGGANDDEALVDLTLCRAALAFVDLDLADLIRRVRRRGVDPHRAKFQVML